MATREYNREYYKKYPERVLAKNRKWENNNKEYRKKYRKEYYKKNRERILARQKEWACNNKEPRRIYMQQYHSENEERSKQYRRDNKEHIRKREKEYKLKNKERDSQRANEKGYGKKFYARHREKVLAWNARYRNSPKGRYSTYKRNAKHLKRIFEITFEEFTQFWQEPCYYCGSDIEYVGLDRIDNNIGYQIDNIVSCCEICNKMKVVLPIDVFIGHCYKIANKQQQKLEVIKCV